MVGNHNSVWSRVRDAAPYCIRMPCTCHSINLCTEKSFEKLPSNLGFILVEVPKWFKNSSLRREQYTELFAIMSPDRDEPSPFKKLSATRWLCRGKVMSDLLLNWDELTAYFLCASQTGPQNVRYKARLLAEMFQDQANRMYFEFAVPVVAECERLNATFQANNADPHTLATELDIHHKSLKARVYSTNGAALSIDDVQFGAKFLQSIHASRFDPPRCVAGKCY